MMETELMAERKERLKKSKKKWVAKVVNTQTDGNRGMAVTTDYDSEHHTLEQIAHKIELDLMTNLELGFTGPIGVVIKEKK